MMDQEKADESKSTDQTEDDINSNVHGVQLMANVIEASKDGEIVKFTIQTKEIKSGEECEERGHIVVREYEDFQWLDHCIRTENDIEGVIVPPLQIKPRVTAHATENKSKKQLGAKTSTMVGDEFTKDCRSLQKYLQLLLAHPLFYKDENLRKFLVKEELPARVKIKRGLLDSLSRTVGEVRFQSHRDIDEEFQKKRDFVNKYSLDVKAITEAFTKMVNSQHKVASDLGAFATVLSNSITDGTNSSELNRLLSELAQCFEKSRESHNVMAINNEKTFGFTTELYTLYMENVKSMFLQRTQKLVKFENAKKSAEKAKPQTKEELEKAMETAEKEFKDISEKSEKEFARFQLQRVLSFQSSLVKFTEAQISNARDTYAIMGKLLSNVKAM